MTTASDRAARTRKAASLWREGLSLRQIAAQLSVHHSTIQMDLWDVRARARKKPVPLRDRRMQHAAEMRTAGMTLRQMAAELNVSHQTVANDLARWDQTRPTSNVLPSVKKWRHIEGPNATPLLDSTGRQSPARHLRLLGEPNPAPLLDDGRAPMADDDQAHERGPDD